MTAYGFRCPTDPAHGKLIDWPTERFAWHCPHTDHDGYRDRPATRAFFTTEEAETGVLAPTPAPHLAAGQTVGSREGRRSRRRTPPAVVG